MSSSQDLIQDLKGELGGKFETLIVALMTAPLAYDVTSLRDAIKVRWCRVKNRSVKFSEYSFCFCEVEGQDRGWSSSVAGRVFGTQVFSGDWVYHIKSSLPKRQIKEHLLYVQSFGLWKCTLWSLGGRHRWEGAGGDSGFQERSSGEGHRRRL